MTARFQLAPFVTLTCPLPRRCHHRDSFDAVYGASAGAINATYFLTGQPEGVSIYADDIANKTFCDLSRLVGRHAGAGFRFATCRICACIL